MQRQLNRLKEEYDCVSLSEMNDTRLDQLVGPRMEQKIFVKSGTFNAMYKALEVQLKVKRYFTEGAGNNIVDIYLSCGASYARMLLARSRITRAMDGNPRAEALNGVQCAGANCGEHADLAFLLLVSALADDDFLLVKRVQDINENHSYDVIENREDPANPIIVDAYASLPVVHTLAEARSAAPDLENVEQKYLSDFHKDEIPSFSRELALASSSVMNNREVRAYLKKEEGLPQGGSRLRDAALDKTRPGAPELFDVAICARDVSTIYVNEETGEQARFDLISRDYLNRYLEARSKCENKGYLPLTRA